MMYTVSLLFVLLQYIPYTPAFDRRFVPLEWKAAKCLWLSIILKCFVCHQDGSAQAQSNLKFLSTLKGPCEELAQAQPKDIPGMLSKILNIIRMIWMNSEHYKSRERLTGLLRKVDLVFGKVAYGEIGCKVSEVLSELTAAQGFVPVIAYGFWGSWSLKRVDHFYPFLHCVPSV